ncbi:DoxX family protein [Microbacteriaceae bacterium VKM Ac-2855]|nr:DoxX family protein [Microbacteriaceae bacterium VKM Ac-2855]
MIHVILFGLLAVLFVYSGLIKLLGAASSLETRDALRIPPARWQAIGALEMLGVIGLMLGLTTPWIGVAAASGLALVMVGALVVRMRAAESRARAARFVAVDVVALLLCVAALVSRALGV